jgi:hypothetical protein
MSTLDIIISIFIALIVNLATPLIRRWLISGITGFNTKIGMANSRLYEKRIIQLEESLAWYKVKSDLRKLLEWILPHVFINITFLWFLVLLPYFIEIAEQVWIIPETVSKGAMYGLIGLGTRYFFSFAIVATMAQKSLSFEETEIKINKQISTLNQRLSDKNG